MVMDSIRERAARQRKSRQYTVLYVISRVDRILTHADDPPYCLSKDTHVADGAMASGLVTTLPSLDDALLVVPVLSSPYSSGRVTAWPPPRVLVLGYSRILLEQGEFPTHI